MVECHVFATTLYNTTYIAHISSGSGVARHEHLVCSKRGEDFQIANPIGMRIAQDWVAVEKLINLPEETRRYHTLLKVSEKLWVRPVGKRRHPILFLQLDSLEIGGEPLTTRAPPLTP